MKWLRHAGIDIRLPTRNWSITVRTHYRGTLIQWQGSSDMLLVPRYTGWITSDRCDRGWTEALP